MLLRVAYYARHLPPVSCPALFSVGLSLTSTLHRFRLTSPYFATALRQSHAKAPQTFVYKRVSLSPMLADHLHPCSNVSASFTTRSSSEVDREILVQHLLVKDDNLKLLVELEKRVSQGEDLSDLAVEYSICPSNKEGGMLGWVRKGQTVPEFEEAAFSAPINMVVRCKTEFGWHLLQVLSEREESLLEDIQPEEFHVKMQDPSFFEQSQLIDVREPEEVIKASLPRFQVLPLCQFGNWGPEISTKFDPQKDTYVLCHHGVRSSQIAKWLQAQGFKRVFNVAGGIHHYAVKVDPSIPTY